MQVLKNYWEWIFLGLAVVFVVVGFSLYGTKDGKPKDLPPTPTVVATTVSAKPTYAALPEMKIDTAKKYIALIVTNMGPISVELDAAKAPQTVNNFVFLARAGFYDGLTFHRIVKDFVIQGGDPAGNGSGGPGYKVPFEADNGLKHDYGSIAMAKQSGDKDMSGSQFYIVTNKDGVHNLDGQYNVFGKVVEGLQNVDKIGAVETSTGDAPKTPVKIERVVIEEK
ncbi:MAG: peptidylprolyl isomerase [bacterium]